MKINKPRHIFSFAFLFFLVACSTKKDTFLARNSHALSTKYNILYNGQIGLDKGIVGIQANTKDNFWKLLPIERMQINDEVSVEGKPKNSDFELAETKATSAIQKHSMNIGGREKNSQIDEAYLLLGKARYYDQRFVPALDAFNYVLYKYPNSSNIYQAKIWREKTNIRLGNDALAVNDITALLKDKDLKNQVFADANAILAEAFINLEEKDSAVAKLKLAVEFTKKNNEKARFRFILGQLYEELGKEDSAIYSYQSVIDMNRKAERKYVIQSYVKKAQLFDYEKGDTALFVKTYDKLVKDRENRPFLDVIYYNMGMFYDKNNNQEKALDFYNASLKTNSPDQYLIASDYRNIGNMYFKNKDYQNAAKYYDKTLENLDVKTREYLQIQKTRKNLDEVIKYETISKRNDSIIEVVSLSDTDKVMYFEKYIEKLKNIDILKKVLAEKQNIELDNIERNSKTNTPEPITPDQKSGEPAKKSPILPPSNVETSVKETASLFYFYNPATVAYGKLEFKKNWGQRAQGGNWRLANIKTAATANETTISNTTTANTKEEEEKLNEKYTTEYYIKQLPKTQTEIDSIVKERNFTNYQLGIIYKEKFKEYELASAKLEKLLLDKPEEKLILPTNYNLYKIYQITNTAKAEEIKNRISSQYPDSRYAQIINNTNPKDISLNETPEGVYNNLYKLYEDEHFTSVLEKVDVLINQYSGDVIVSKFELLKASTIAKRYGLAAYKKALQEVADNYPNSEEGKDAQEKLTTQIPFLEKMEFTNTDSKKWKILFRISPLEDKKTGAIEEKIMKFFANENFAKLYYSCDNYTEKESLITIHGIKSEAYAKDVATEFTENKKYKTETPPIVISEENYRVIQIKKNIETYLAPTPTKKP